MQAQLSVYGGPALTAYGFTSNGFTAFSRDGGGLLGGAFYNFPIDSRVTVGVDGRASYSFGSRGGTYVLGAVRLGFVPDRNPLRPYFQIGGGVASSRATSGMYSSRYTNVAAELAFGLDVRLNERFDIRAFELGAAAGAHSGSSESVAVSFLNAGIVYHLH